MKCKNCGEEMYPNHPFCPNCGVENKADAIVENEVSVGTPAEATARPTENAVSEPAVMHFEWAGTSKGKKSWVMSVVINGNEWWKVHIRMHGPATFLLTAAVMKSS